MHLRLKFFHKLFSYSKKVQGDWTKVRPFTLIHNISLEKLTVQKINWQVLQDGPQSPNLPQTSSKGIFELVNSLEVSLQQNH